MDQGYGGWCGRLCGVGREGGVPAQFRRRAGGRGPETTPERGYHTSSVLVEGGRGARAAHWTSALSFPGRCVRIGRQDGWARWPSSAARRWGGLRGALQAFGTVPVFHPGWVGGACRTPPLRRARCLFRKTPQNGASAGRAMTGSRGARGSVAWDRDGIAAFSRAVVPACLGTCGVGWGLRVAQEVWGAGPEGRVGGAGSDPLPPVGAVQSSRARCSLCGYQPHWATVADLAQAYLGQDTEVRCGVPS